MGFFDVVKSLLGGEKIATDSGPATSTSKPYSGFDEPKAEAVPASEPPKPRRIVTPPRLVSKADQVTWSSDVAIKAQPAKDRKTCTFFVDRPVLDGYSAWYADAASAPGSPLAEKLFSDDRVRSVMLHNYTVTITGVAQYTQAEWQQIAKDIGKVLRSHFLGGYDVVPKAYFDSMPDESEIRTKLQQVINDEINPGVAGHGGEITLKRVEGNSVYITMGGGCQGCSAASLTLREGIFNAFRTAVPQVGAILDETDHSAGTNPFFSEPIDGVS